MATFTSDTDGKLMRAIKLASRDQAEELWRSDRVFFETPDLPWTPGGQSIFSVFDRSGSLTGELMVYEVLP